MRLLCRERLLLLFQNGKVCYLGNEDEALRHGGADDHEHGDGDELHGDVVSEREGQHQGHYTEDHHVVNTHPDLLGIV